MATAAQIDTYADEAIAAYAEGDFDTALQKLTAARMALSVKPDSRHESSELRWDRTAINNAIEDVKRAQRAAASNAGRITQIPTQLGKVQT